MHNGNISDHIHFEKTTKAALYKDERLHVLLLNLPEGEELKPHVSKTDAYCIVPSNVPFDVAAAYGSYFKTIEAPIKNAAMA